MAACVADGLQSTLIECAVGSPRAVRLCSAVSAARDEARARATNNHVNYD